MYSETIVINFQMHMKDMGGQARFRHRKNMKVFVQVIYFICPKLIIYKVRVFSKNSFTYSSFSFSNWWNQRRDSWNSSVFLSFGNSLTFGMGKLFYWCSLSTTPWYYSCIVILYRADMRPNIHLCGKKQTRSRDIMVSRVFTTSKSLDHIDSH